MSLVGPSDETFSANGGVTLRNVLGLSWTGKKVGLYNCNCHMHFMIQLGSGRQMGDGLGLAPG